NAKEKEPPPPRAASLRLNKLQPVRIKAGQKTTVHVTIQRENYSGPVQVSAKHSENVFVRGQVDEGKQEGVVELAVTAGANEGERRLLLQAFALGAGVSHAESDLSLTILPPDVSPPMKPSLRLLGLAVVKVMAGQTTKVPVKIERQGCEGLVEITLAK